MLMPNRKRIFCVQEFADLQEYQLLPTLTESRRMCMEIIARARESVKNITDRTSYPLLPVLISYSRVKGVFDSDRTCCLSLTWGVI